MHSKSIGWTHVHALQSSAQDEVRWLWLSLGQSLGGRRLGPQSLQLSAAAGSAGCKTGTSSVATAAVPSNGLVRPGCTLALNALRGVGPEVSGCTATGGTAMPAGASGGWSGSSGASTQRRAARAAEDRGTHIMHVHPCIPHIGGSFEMTTKYIYISIYIYIYIRERDQP
jgi:hypothetical protein